jgi:hypothetical protein
MAFPQSVAQDHDASCAHGPPRAVGCALGFLRPKTPAEERRHAEYVEELVGYRGGEDVFRVVASGEGSAAASEQRHVLEGLGLVLPVGVVGNGDPARLDVDIGIDLGDGDDSLGFRKRQRREEDPVDHAEDGGVGADP